MDFEDEKFIKEEQSDDLLFEAYDEPIKSKAIKLAKHGKEECPYCKAIPEEILEDCFVQGYRILCNDNRKVVENFLEKIENILKENTTETMVNKLEKDKEKIM